MPYYAFNLLCGLDETGKGVIYGYDAVGSYDTLTYGAQGSGVQLGIPILDNQFIGHNFKVKVLPESQEEVENTATTPRQPATLCPCPLTPQACP